MAYWAWLKKDYFWKRSDKQSKETAESSIRKMLELIVKLWPKEKGQGWNTAKFHEQLHIPRDIERNGNPHNSYAGPLEHNHLDTKGASERTQKRRVKLDEQTGERVTESHIINRCYDIIYNEDEEIKNPIY